MNAGTLVSLILTAMAGGVNIVVACLLERRARRLVEWERELVEVALELARQEGAADAAAEEDGQLSDEGGQMIRIVDDCRTQTRLFTCPKCGTEYLADYSEAKEEPWDALYVTCPVCTYMERWTSGRIQCVEEKDHEE